MFGCMRRRHKLNLIIEVQDLLVRKVNKLMADVAALDGAILALSAKVDAIVVPVPVPPVPVDLQPQVDAVNAIGAKIDAKFPPAPPAA